VPPTAIPAPQASALLLPSPTATLAVLALAAVALFALSCLDIALDHTSALLLQFETGDEANVATWWASTTWLVAGGLALAIGVAGRRLHARGASRWIVLGCVFALLAADETAQFHEQAVGPLMDAVQSLTGLGHTSARLLSAGSVGMVLLAGAIWLAPWLRALPRTLARRLVVAGTIFVGGSVGLEVLSRMVTTRYLSPFEELCEMLGVALLIAALVPYVRTVTASPAVRSNP
jgi:uncharacterized membrane protein YhaH (DUF805 family)